MSNLKFLPSIHDSETVTCPRCNLSQYPRRGTCVRCQAPLGLECLSLAIDDLFGSYPEDHKKQIACGIGMLIRVLRKRRGFCQSQLAGRSRGLVNRSNLSRAECGRTLLPLNKLLSIAKALGLTTVILRFDVAPARSTQLSGKRV